MLREGAPGKRLLAARPSQEAMQLRGRFGKPLERDLDSFCGHKCAAQEALCESPGLPAWASAAPLPPALCYGP